MRRIVAVAAALAASWLSGAPALAAPPAPPPGFTLDSRVYLAGGVAHETYRRATPAQVVHVARVAPSAKVALRVVRAGRQPDGRTLERTSSMCARVRCLAAVNGDFFDPKTGELVGGMVSAGQPVRSPGARHHQLTITPDRRLVAGVASFRVKVVPTDLEPIDVDAVNVARGVNQLVLYTPAAGRTTGTNDFGIELVGRVERPKAPVRLGQTALVHIVGVRRGAGNTPVPAGGLVLSGHGTAARELEALAARIKAGKAASRVLLRVESTPDAAESLGGSPVLVRGGKRYVATTGPSFVTGRHPRTAVGWTAAGDVLLVTVDGRQPGHSVGMSLPELADFLVRLGAREAINLDGGGSSAFVTRGSVANRPSDRLVRRGDASAATASPRGSDRVLGFLERPVGNALAIVPLTRQPGAIDPLAGLLDLPRAVEVGDPVLLDPGSNPTVALPAIVVDIPERVVWPIGVAAALAGGVALGTLLAGLRTRRAATRP